MKKALAITLMSIVGFGVNFLAVLGLYCPVFFVTDNAAICFAAAVAVIAAFTALLNFVRKKLANMYMERRLFYAHSSRLYYFGRSILCSLFTITKQPEGL